MDSERLKKQTCSTLEVGEEQVYLLYHERARDSSRISCIIDNFPSNAIRILSLHLHFRCFFREEDHVGRSGTIAW